MKPKAVVVVNGAIELDKLLSITLTDKRGWESDSSTLSLDDKNGTANLLEQGDTLDIALGWTGLFHSLGLFKVDKVTCKSPPQTITVNAKSADLQSTLKIQKTRSWHEKKLSEIVKTIASEHNLKSAVGESIQDKLYQHIDQTTESDINFLTRLSKDLDALCSVKKGHLIVARQGDAKTASGSDMPSIPVSPKKKISWSSSTGERDKYSSIRAEYHSKLEGERKFVVAGDGQPRHTLKDTFTNKELAQSAAESKLLNVKRGIKSLSFTSEGNPSLLAEVKIIASGFRENVDAEYVVVSAVHKWSSSGYTTKIEAEQLNE